MNTNFSQRAKRCRWPLSTFLLLGLPWSPSAVRANDQTDQSPHRKTTAALLTMPEPAQESFAAGTTLETMKVANFVNVPGAQILAADTPPPQTKVPFPSENGMIDGHRESPSPTPAGTLRLEGGRRLDGSNELIRQDQGQVFVRAELAQQLSFADTVQGPRQGAAQAAPHLANGGLPVDASSVSAAGTTMIIEDKSNLGAITSAGASLVGTLVVASAYADLSSELVDLSETIAINTTNDDASSNNDEDPPLDADDSDDPEADLADGDAGGDEGDGEGGSTTPENQPPTFIELTGTGSVSETAQAGTLTGVAVTALDPEGAAVTYAIVAQDIPGAFGVHAENGTISVASPELIDFESHESLSITVSATDPEEGTTTQTLSIRIEDDSLDALKSVPTYTQAHDSLSSGALVFGSRSTDSAFPDGRFGHGGVETTTGQARIDLYLNAQEYFIVGPDGVDSSLAAASFSALPKIDLVELDNGEIVLGSFNTSSNFLMSFSVTETDFSGQTGFNFGSLAKSVHANASGVPDERYQFSDGNVMRLSEPAFADPHAALDLDAVDILHFADLTGDGQAEMLVRQGVGEDLVVFENLGNGFADEAMAQTLFTGVDLDALAGGRLLDLSLRDHFSSGETNLVLLGTEATYLYELT